MAITFNFNKNLTQKNYNKTFVRAVTHLERKNDKPSLDAADYEGKIYWVGAYWDIDVLTLEDIIKLLNLTEEESKLARSIIYNAEHFAKENLLEDCIAHYPYIGNFRIDPGQRNIYLHKIGKAKDNDVITDTKSRNEIYSKGWQEFFSEKQKLKDNQKIINEYKKENAENYKILVKSLGKEQTDEYIIQSKKLNFVDFNEDFENAFQRLN